MLSTDLFKYLFKYLFKDLFKYAMDQMRMHYHWYCHWYNVFMMMKFESTEDDTVVMKIEGTVFDQNFLESSEQ